MNITLTGNLGSGKSSVCKELKELGFEIISTGTIFREIAQEKGISVTELNELAKNDRSIDDMIDNRSIELGKKKNNVVFDSRLAWNFIPDSFKVFIMVETNEAARRVFQGENRQAETYADEADAAEGLKKRAQLEKERYATLYGIDYYDASNYNLVIESTNATPKEIAEEIVRNFRLYAQQPFVGKVQLNLTSIYPSKSVDGCERFETFVETERQNANVCAAAHASVTEAQGNFYYIEGQCPSLAALSLGKKFVEADFDFSQKAKDVVLTVSQENVKKFEEKGGFQYRAYPEEHKNNYMINLAPLAQVSK